ncbi:hypothetical protein BRADI_3g10490v3 [Brachypodium distachyon]|uniref:DUF4283 domain-containing protein n=1 Tax=Brachypodium distachyon TaxID=15368 RepID=A0A0Q3I1R2_BRADI|nr:hypothetical protein BRADI_3g10490v3 [Brachypodium distachyon]
MNAGQKKVAKGNAGASSSRLPPVTWELPGEKKKVLAVNMEELKKDLPSEWMLVGKYYTTHTFSSWDLFNHLREIWQLRGGMEYKELANNRFLVLLEHEGDYHHILGGGPWTHLGDVMVVVAFDGRSTVLVPMMNEKMGRELGELVGKVRMVHADNRGKIWRDFVRVRIEHVMAQPIQRCIYIDEVDKEGKVRQRRCQVKYEKLPSAGPAKKHLRFDPASPTKWRNAFTARAVEAVNQEVMASEEHTVSDPLIAVVSTVADAVSKLMVGGDGKTEQVKDLVDSMQQAARGHQSLGDQSQKKKKKKKWGRVRLEKKMRNQETAEQEQDQIQKDGGATQVADSFLKAKLQILGKSLMQRS